MEGDFVQVIKDEVSGKTAVPPPSLNPALIRDLHVKFPLGKATVPEENVAKQISAWTIPQTLKKQFVATMEEVAHSASVEYKAFFLRLDVPSGDAVYGVLVGVGRKFNGSHVQIGYALASATGTLIQQKERVGYSCCKQHVLGICVDHTTCHKEVDRGDTAAEVQAVAATLEGCLKHQVQHLSYWLDPADYKGCSNNLTCQVAPEVNGCGSGISRAEDAVSPQDLLQSLWDDQSLQESLHDKSPGLRDWKRVYNNVEGLVGSSKFAGIPVGQVTSFARGFFHLSDSAVLPFQIFEEESRPGSALVFDRLQLVATDTDQDMTYEAALVLRCTGESFNIWTLLFEQKLNQTLPPGSSGMLEEWRSVRRSHGSFRSLDHHTNDRLHNISHPLDIKTMNISMNMFLMLAVKAVAREENVPLAPHVAGTLLLPSSWLGAVQPHQGSWGSAFSNFEKAVGSLTGALEKIIGVFGKKSSTKLVKEETCLGFNHYDQNVTYVPLRCLEDKYAAEFLVRFLRDDLLWWFHGDEDKLAAFLLGFEGSYEANWTQDQFNVQNVNMSTPRYLHVYKNKENPKASCSNWVIVRSEINFELADDLFFWDVSTSSFGGLFQDETIRVERVPHKISAEDVFLLRQFMHGLIIMVMADELGITYKVPVLPQCHDVGRLVV